ncbi:MAG TPA: hypothetical protein PK358_06705 [Spirochaetota bacterium]|nr:hypothetical protein [Spirochaetota bacterium]HPJ34507.1 hypothetical protein [Spirochaetota bacterium]
MIIRKSSINDILRKEKDKVRKSCEREFSKKLNSMKLNLENTHSKNISSIKDEYEDIIDVKNREIEKLKNIIDRNYIRYQEVRQREKYLDALSHEIENVIDHMVVRVQESVQPFYRTRSKVLSIKKVSDKSDDKMKKVLVMKK